MKNENGARFHLLIPIYNDWNSLGQLMNGINAAAGKANVEFTVHIINDASSEPMPDGYLEAENFEHIESIQLIDLIYNMGPQRAIAVGLAEIAKLKRDLPVLIMDGDGDDDPADIPKLVDAHLKNSNVAIMAQRTNRSNGFVFVLFYTIYKMLFKALTGFGISFGNFCIMPNAIVQKLIYSPNLWNHMAATLLRSKIPFEAVPLARAKRIAGNPKMDFVSLVLHGLHAIAVFTEIALVRLAAIILSLNLVLVIVIFLIRILTDWVVAGWASNMVGFVVVLSSMALFGLLIGTLMALFSKSTVQMLPALQGGMLVKEIRRIR